MNVNCMKKKEFLINSLVAACERRKFVARASFLRRLILIPRMFFITLLVNALGFFRLTLKYKAKTFWGGAMHVVLPEPVSSEIVRFGFIEEAVANAIVNGLKEGDIALDIGAHFGFFSMLMAECVGQTGQVHAFEPMPDTFSILELNSAGLSLTLNKMAAWKECSILELHNYGMSCSAFNSIRQARIGKHNLSAEPSFVSVKSVSIDDYVIKNGIAPSFIKIDAESSEYEVLCGMRHTLSVVRPKICIELGDLGVDGATSSRLIIDMMIRYGYSPFEWHAGAFRSHTPRDVYPYTNLLFVPTCSVD